jgi:hypothetical protein
MNQSFSSMRVSHSRPDVVEMKPPLVAVLHPGITFGITRTERDSSSMEEGWTGSEMPGG